MQAAEAKAKIANDLELNRTLAKYPHIPEDLKGSILGELLDQYLPDSWEGTYSTALSAILSELQRRLNKYSGTPGKTTGGKILRAVWRFVTFQWGKL